jgi:hypothetical protein
MVVSSTLLIQVRLATRKNSVVHSGALVVEPHTPVLVECDPQDVKHAAPRRLAAARTLSPTSLLPSPLNMR